MVVCRADVGRSRQSPPHAAARPTSSSTPWALVEPLRLLELNASARKCPVGGQQEYRALLSSWALSRLVCTMGYGTPLTKETYERLVDAFRDAPGNFSAAARAVGCDRRMAKRAWTKGWERHPWARPVEVVLREEHDAARARLSAAHANATNHKATAMMEERTEALLSAAQQEEEMMARMRHTILGTLVVVEEIRGAADVLGKIVLDSIREGTFAESLGINAPRGALDLLGKYVQLQERLVRTASEVVKLSASREGRPTAVLGITPVGHVATPEMSVREAKEWLAHCSDMYTDLQKTGDLPPALQAAFLDTADDVEERLSESKTVIDVGSESNDNPDTTRLTASHG